MNPQARIAIADTGPLLHLAEIEKLHQLRVFARVHLAATVRAEFAAQMPGAVESLHLTQTHMLPAADVARFATDNVLEHLHQAGRESIHLCFFLNVPLLLTDDLAVRKAATRLGLTPVGSLGVIGRSYRLGHISLNSAQETITDLYRNSELCGMLAIPELAVAYLRQLAQGVEELSDKSVSGVP